MGHASAVVEEAIGHPTTEAIHPPPPIRFVSLEGSEPQRAVAGRGLTLAVSIVLHTALVIAMVVLPLVFDDSIPGPGGLKAFFVAPLEIAPPPPPPPPPAPSRLATKAEPRPEPIAPSAFIAPIEVPEEIQAEAGLDLGVEGGVLGGVEGGVPGGVVGGVVGGLPAPPPPPRVVRVGGQIAAPKLVHRVTPVYPQLAVDSRVAGLIILEAQVDTRGHVKALRVLSGNPLFEESALAAVKQWRYQPLLLNGQPTEFIMNVTVVFSLRT